MTDYSKWTLEQFKESLDLCLNCGACYARGPIVPHNWRELPPHEWSSPLRKCPSFEYYKFRAYTGVGRLTLAALVFLGRTEISNDLIKIAYTCTSCGVCNEICRTHQPLYAILALREEIVRSGSPRPKILDKIEKNMEAFGNMMGAKKAPEILKEIPNKGEDIYFAGCNARFRKPEVARATAAILKATGLNIAHLGKEEKCCGFAAKQGGNRELFEKVAAVNIETMKRAGAKRIILSCAHCYQAWKNDYPMVFGSLPFEVVHIAEVLAQLMDQGKLKVSKKMNKKVTYHDPCFLGRHNKVYDAPREVLRNIPGIELIEMERYGNWSCCCGSGAKVSSGCYPDFGAAVAKERLLEGKAAADTIVTACTTCFQHMSTSVAKEKMDLRVYDLPILMAKAMGVEF
jgi:heterodisulfide reductase subunit D